jgi:hypothetical protein
MRSSEIPLKTRNAMSFQPRTGISEGRSADRPWPFSMPAFSASPRPSLASRSVSLLFTPRAGSAPTEFEGLISSIGRVRLTFPRSRQWSGLGIWVYPSNSHNHCLLADVPSILSAVCTGRLAPRRCRPLDGQSRDQMHGPQYDGAASTAVFDPTSASVICTNSRSCPHLPRKDSCTRAGLRNQALR